MKKKNGAEDTATGITADTNVVMTNTKNGVVPTGIFMGLGGVASVTLLGTVGVGYFILKNKKREG